jgi:hypothetical protein
LFHLADARYAATWDKVSGLSLKYKDARSPYYTQTIIHCELGDLALEIIETG